MAAVTDAVILSSAVDGVVLLAKAGKTTKDAVVRARRALSDVQARNPELTRSFCPRAQAGLIDVAMGRAPLHQAILVEQATGLSVLPSPRPNNVAALTEFVFSEGLGTIFDVRVPRMSVRNASLRWLALCGVLLAAGGGVLVYLKA